MSSVSVSVSADEAGLALGLLGRLADTQPGVAGLRGKLGKSVDTGESVQVIEAEVRLLVEACEEFDATLWFAGKDRDKQPVKCRQGMPDQHKELCQRMKAILDND